MFRSADRLASRLVCLPCPYSSRSRRSNTHLRDCSSHDSEPPNCPPSWAGLGRLRQQRSSQQVFRSRSPGWLALAYGPAVTCCGVEQAKLIARKGWNAAMIMFCLVMGIGNVGVVETDRVRRRNQLTMHISHPCVQLASSIRLATLALACPGAVQGQDAESSSPNVVLTRMCDEQRSGVSGFQAASRGGKNRRTVWLDRGRPPRRVHSQQGGSPVIHPISRL